jgi:hypothetical protein
MLRRTFKLMYRKYGKTFGKMMGRRIREWKIG